MRKLLILILLLPSMAQAAPTSRPADYAFQALLQENDSSLQRVVLPAEVLQHLTRGDRGDIAVFNLDGKLLPLAVYPTRATKTPRQLELPLHEFDRFLKQRSKIVTTREQSQQDGSLSELATTETIEVQSVLKTYLIELKPDDERRKFQRIELDWRHEPASQVLRVKVEAGNELDRLRTVTANKSLTNQQSDDLKWRSIRGVSSSYKYLRLTPINDVNSFELLGAIGHYEESSPPPKVTIQIEPEVGLEENGKIYSYVNPSPVYPEAIRIVPAEPNSIIRGDLFLKWINDDKRLPVKKQFQQHNIEDDQVKPSRPIDLPRNFYNEVWFNSNTELAQTPRVELIYPQYEVAFLADGNAPYSLAWGNHEVKAAPPTLKGLVGNTEWAEAEIVGMLAIEEAGGVSRLAPEPTLPWKKYMLWALLIIAVFITGRMAVKLYREMNRPESA